MTAEEFLALHGDESNVELVKGRVVRYAPTGGRKGEVCANAAFYLGDFIKKHGLGRAMSNDTFTRTGVDTIRGADVCYLSYSRLPKDQETPSGPVPSPDLVIEVRSPTDRLNRLMSKAYEYLEAGVVVVVLLFPETQSATIFRNEELPVQLGSNDELMLPDVLSGFAVRVSAFFE